MDSATAPKPAPGPALGPPSGQASEEAWRRNLLVCVFGAFTTVLAMTLLLPFLPLYVAALGVRDQGAVAEWSGITFGATFLASGAAAPFWGRVADRTGRKPILIRASLGMTLCMALTGTVQSVWQLLAVRLLTGLLGGYASGSTLLVATQTPRRRSAWALGVLSSGIMAGSVAGPLLGGALPLPPQAMVANAWQLLALRFAMGVALAGLSPAITSMIRHSVPAVVAGRILSLNTSAQYVGFVAGPLLGGVVAAHLGMRPVFCITSLLMLAGAALAARLRDLPAAR